MGYLIVEGLELARRTSERRSLEIDEQTLMDIKRNRLIEQRKMLNVNKQGMVK